MSAAPAPTSNSNPTPSIATDRVVILYLVMLIAAAGNTAMQSILPAISSELKIADFWVSIAFSWSAVLWVFFAPRWARLSDKRGRKALMKMGTAGFIASTSLCAAALWLGLNGYVAAATAFIFFGIFRGLYGMLGSAAPPAVQAYVAARTERSERTKALSLLASSFGLGTVIGPAIAHFLVFQPLGLAGPMAVFAAFAVLVLVALQFRLPNDEPKFAARGPVTAYPSAASIDQPEQNDDEADSHLPTEEVRLPWRDKRIAPWLIAGLVGGHAHAIMMGVVGFLVRDRLGLQDNPAEAVQAIGSVMFIGAMATLVAQWGLIPILSPRPRTSVLWGAIFAFVGVAIVGVSHDPYTISLGFAISSLGFGLFRPGFTAGASLAVSRAEQGNVAGKIASIAGAAYIFAPALGVWLFSIWEPATFILMGAMLLWLFALANRKL